MVPTVGGATPLCQHIIQVIDQIKTMEPLLRASAQRAVVIIITDGEASDGDILQALRPLQVSSVLIRPVPSDEAIGPPRLVDCETVHR